MVCEFMGPLDTYRSNAAELPILRKWVLMALVVSLLLHAGLYLFFQSTDLEGFTPPSEPVIVKRAFVVNKVTIDPKLLEPERIRPTPQMKKPVSPIVIPNEKPQTKDFELKPQTTESTAMILPPEKPNASPINWDAITKRDAESNGRAEKELGSIAAALLTSSSKAPKQPSITLPQGNRDGEGIGGSEGIPGRQSIDDALARAGTSQGASQPVAMPGGALFEHGSADLRPESLEALQKIGELILLYPNAAFVISGHTDWTGTPEFNQVLSTRRAQAVKDWLVTAMHVGAERIQITGRGTADAIVSADKSVEEQRPNRRVEIVIKTRKK
ncbi:MAG: outer membrane protein OmpA-like peptidoglycan-associated protein [Chthoniobacteraceae bacterium]|nr:outer membrane protein OmpA-like peptidoglycan-associated protein [Chthoniobacteraceae bacterium]